MNDLRHYLDVDQTAVDLALKRALIFTVMPQLHELLDRAADALTRDLWGSSDLITRRIAAQLLVHQLAEFVTLKQIDSTNVIPVDLLASAYAREFFAPFTDLEAVDDGE